MSNHNAGTWKHLEIIMEDYGVSYPPISEGFYPCRDAFDSRVVVETVTNLEAWQRTATIKDIGAHSGLYV